MEPRSRDRQSLTRRSLKTSPHILLRQSSQVVEKISRRKITKILSQTGIYPIIRDSVLDYRAVSGKVSGVPGELGCYSTKSTVSLPATAKNAANFFHSLPVNHPVHVQPGPFALKQTCSKLQSMPP